MDDLFLESWLPAVDKVGVDPKLPLDLVYNEWRTHAGGIPVRQNPSPVPMVPKQPDSEIGLELEGHEFERMAGRAAMGIGSVVWIVDV
jgi:hypothetical protein